jgi:hypothetical protein
MGCRRLSFLLAGIAVVALTVVFYHSPEYPRTMSYLASSNLTEKINVAKIRLSDFHNTALVAMTEKINVAKIRLSDFHNTALAPYLSQMNVQAWELSNTVKDKVFELWQDAQAWEVSIIMNDKVSKLRKSAWFQDFVAGLDKALATVKVRLSPFWNRYLAATYEEKLTAVAAVLVALVCILVLRRRRARKASTEPLVAAMPAEMVQPAPVAVRPDPKILAERSANLRHRTSSPAPINRVHDENAPALANANSFLTHLNQVSDEDMKLIPGLGEKSVQMLTKYRSSVGAFTTWDDLRTAGVKPVVLAKLQKGSWHINSY